MTAGTIAVLVFAGVVVFDLLVVLFLWLGSRERRKKGWSERPWWD